MPLKLTRRHGSLNFYIRGSIRGIRVDESTGLSQRKAAEEVLALRSAQIVTRAVHGDRGTRTFGEAALSYMEAGGERQHLGPILVEIGARQLGSIGQSDIEGLAKKLKPRAAPSTTNRQIFTPIVAVLTHAAARRWCDRPVIERPEQPEGRVRWITSEEADRLIGASVHLAPLIMFLLCTGCRISEALYLDWRQVDLDRAHVSFLNQGAGGPGTKNQQSRGVPLHTRAVDALRALGHRTGPVFRVDYGGVRKNGSVRPIGPGYADRGGEGGGQVKTAWGNAIRRAGITDFSPHDCRHTWATWHYAANRDLNALMELGGWKSVEMVLRYTHVNASHLASSIDRMWIASAPSSDPDSDFALSA